MTYETHLHSLLTLIQLLCSFDEATRLEKILIQTFACQLIQILFSIDKEMDFVVDLVPKSDAFPVHEPQEMMELS